MNRKPAFDMLQCTLCATAYAVIAFILSGAVCLMVIRGVPYFVELASAFATFAALVAFILVYLHLRTIPARY